MFEFMTTLSENKLIPSMANLRQYRADDLADLAVIYFCALYIIFSEDKKDFAKKYAHNVLRYGASSEKWVWQTNANDLYIILYGLRSEIITLKDTKFSDKFKKTLPFGETILIRWLRDLESGKVISSTNRQFFMKMDFNFKISNGSLRSFRRLAMDWDKLDDFDKELTITRLLQLLYSKSTVSDIYKELKEVSKKYSKGDLPKKSVFLATLAGVAAGRSIVDKLK